MGKLAWLWTPPQGIKCDGDQRIFANIEAWRGGTWQRVVIFDVEVC